MNRQHTRARARGVRRFRVPTLLLGALLTLTQATACNDASFAMIQSHLITDEPEPRSAYTCSQLSASGSTSTGENNDGFWITETQDRDGVVIEWGESATQLGRRQFSSEFFERHAMERFVIDAPNGDRFSYMVWGAQSCTPCPEQSHEPLPGDLFGCANANDAGARPANDGTQDANAGNKNGTEGEDTAADEANVHGNE